LTFTLDRTTVSSNNPPTPPDTLAGKRFRARDIAGFQVLQDT